MIGLLGSIIIQAGKFKPTALFKMNSILIASVC